MADSKIYLGPLLEEATAAIVNNLSGALGGVINAMSDRLAGLLDNVKSGVDGMKTATDNMKSAMDSVKSSVTTINSTLGTTNGKIDTTNSRLNTLNTTMGSAVKMALTATGSKTKTLQNSFPGATASTGTSSASSPGLVPDSTFSVGDSSGKITVNVGFGTSSNVKVKLYIYDKTTEVYRLLDGDASFYPSSNMTARDYVVDVMAGHVYCFAAISTSTSNTNINTRTAMTVKFGLTPAAESSEYIS